CREFGTKLGSAVRTLDGGNVEPFVGGDEINLAVAPGGIHHAELKECIRLGTSSHRAETAFVHIETCHFQLPVFSPESLALRPCGGRFSMPARMSEEP